MTVEKRDSDTAHGLKTPTLPGEEGFNEQVAEMLELVECAKEPNDWAKVAEVLKPYFPFEVSALELEEVMEAFGFATWKETVDHVKDDQCWEVFTKVARWAAKEKLTLRKNEDLEGFIDGSGMGVMRVFDEECKSLLEKGFDAKWYFYILLGTLRPIEYLANLVGFPCRAFFNYIHPGHPRYPAGHSCKAAAALVAAIRCWVVEDRHRRRLIIFTLCWSMGRSGGGVHYPEDNMGGFLLADVVEFSGG